MPSTTPTAYTLRWRMCLKVCTPLCLRLCKVKGPVLSAKQSKEQNRKEKKRKEKKRKDKTRQDKKRKEKKIPCFSAIITGAS